MQTRQLATQGKQVPVTDKEYPASHEEHAILLGLIPESDVPLALKQVKQLEGHPALQPTVLLLILVK